MQSEEYACRYRLARNVVRFAIDTPDKRQSVSVISINTYLYYRIHSPTASSLRPSFLFVARKSDGRISDLIEVPWFKRTSCEGNFVLVLDLIPYIFCGSMYWSYRQERGERIGDETWYHWATEVDDLADGSSSAM